MNKEKEAEVRVLQQKVDYFFKENQPIHIKFKKDYWKNGKIIEISSDFFIINEFQEGKLPVFFLEIDWIEPFKEEGENEKS